MTEQRRRTSSKRACEPRRSGFGWRKPRAGSAPSRWIWIRSDWNWSARRSPCCSASTRRRQARSFSSWERAIFVDDVPKIHDAFRAARRTGTFYVEFRVRHSDGSLHWIAGKGQVAVGEPSSHAARRALRNHRAQGAGSPAARGERDAWKRGSSQVREEARTLEVLNRTGVAVAAEHDLERLVQMVTDAGVELSHAEFGAFFYNVIRDTGEAYTLYTLSGAPREAFEKFPDAAQHRDLRADLPRSRAGALRRYSRRPALRQERALPRHAEGPSAGAQLSGGAGRLALGRSAGRTVLRPRRSPAFSPSAPSGS